MSNIPWQRTDSRPQHIGFSNRANTSLIAVFGILFVLCIVRIGIYFAMIAASSEADWLIELQNANSERFTGTGRIVDRFIRRDARQYIELAISGYQTDSWFTEKRTAFYPVWPTVIRPFAAHLSANMAAWTTVFLANVFTVIGALLLFELTRKRYGESCAWCTLVVLNSLPASFFLFLPFSEPLFLCLLSLLLWSIDCNRIALACAACILLPMTRPVGALVFFGVLHWNWSRCSGPARFLPSLCICLGYSLYLGIMYLSTGDAFQGIHAQQLHVNAPSLLRIAQPWLVASSFFEVQSLFHPVEGLLDRLCFLAVIPCLVLLWRLDRTWFWITFPMAIIPAMTNLFLSYRRFIVVLVPLMIVLAWQQTQPEGRPKLLFWGCAASLVLQMFSQWEHVTGLWAG